MMEHLIDWDQKLFLELNSLHTPWLDPIMMLITQTYVWVPLYLFLLYLILKDYRNDSWAILLGVLVAILLADQIPSGIMKPYFQRLRPSREPDLAGLVHIVDQYKGGLYGFASSHAANTFALATFLWLLFKDNRKWIVVLFPWAIMISYTRIYLGVHYPGDVIVGMMVGVVAAIAGYNLYKWLDKVANKARTESGGTQ